jgi:glycosyltransferase involved in cell wall biosynthesis
MRIAIYYESRLGRNDGNPLYVWNCLKKKQAKGLLEVDHLAPIGDKLIQGHYDAHIWCDWGEDGLRHVLPYTPVFPEKNGKDPIIYWPTDTHVSGDSYSYRLGIAKKSDIVFSAQKPAVEQFAKDGVNAIWLPCGVEPQAYPRYELLTKHNDVCFVGHINCEERVMALDRLFKEFPNFFFGQRQFEDCARIYADSKICFNIALNEDVNMRNFEVLGSGGFLLTSRVKALEELLTDGVHCVMYDNLDDMVEKAKYYLEHDEERDRIANAGYEHVIANHTIDHRVNVILDAINKFRRE